MHGIHARLIMGRGCRAASSGQAIANTEGMSSLPHIAHIAMPFARSGSAVTNVIRHLAREHDAAGGETTAVVSDNRSTHVAHARTLGVDHRQKCPQEFYTRTQLALDHAAGRLVGRRPYFGSLHGPAISALQPLRPDVILVHEGHYATSSLPGWRRGHPRAALGLYVHTAHARSYSQRELTRLLGHADFIICVSRFMAERLQERVPRLSTPIHVVLNGTEPDFLEAETEVDNSVLFVGQIAEHKGPHLLVEAARELLRRGHDLRFVFIGSAVHGSGEELSGYERELRARTADHASRFTFLPFMPREELVRHYASAGLLCLPSVFEDPCPLVALEGLSAGSAVVASTRGGIPEIGQMAFRYFDQDKQDDLADALVQALGERDALRAAARRRAVEISWPKQYATLMQHVQTALSRNA